MHWKLQHIACILTCSLSMLSTTAYADNSQQSKMKTCNAEATSQKLSGADRKAYMKKCLSAAPAAVAPAAASTPPAASAPAATPIPATK